MRVKNEKHLNNGKASYPASKKSPPNGGKRPFTLKGLPTPSWSQKQLVDGARYQWGQLQAAEKKAAVHVFRLGTALALLKPLMTKRRGWGKFLKDLHLSETTAWRAMELFTRAKTEDQVASLPITEAYEQFGIIAKPEISADEDEAQEINAAKMGRKKNADVKKKAAAKQVEAKETASKIAAYKGKHGVAYEEVGQPEDEEDEDFGCGELFEEFAARNGWDNQRQVQLLVDFWGQEIHDTLLRDAHKEEMRDFLAEQEKLPPPKEPNSPLAVIARLRNRLNLLANEIKAVDWAKESSADYLERLDEIVAAVEQLRMGVPQ